MPPTASPRKFHFALTVADLDRAVDFYRALLGAAPIARRGDFARFDVDDPPLALSLYPGRAAGGGALNHVGFRVADSRALVAVQERLELSGIRTQREEGVECCYALQTKFWVPDADRNLWEVYTVHEDLDHSGFGGDGHGAPPPGMVSREQVVWRVTGPGPAPTRIPCDDDSIDEVVLEGACFAELDHPGRTSLLKEAMRALRPGGGITAAGIALRGLGSERAGSSGSVDPDTHSGLGALGAALHDELVAAGFIGLECKLERTTPHRTTPAARSVRLTGKKPIGAADREVRFVLYRGPMAQVKDEQGRFYIRGVRTAVDGATWSILHEPPYDEHFTCFACADQPKATAGPTIASSNS